MPPRRPSSPFPGRQIGYARVSTDEQNADSQIRELRAAGCDKILEERASGASSARPVLSSILRDIDAGDTLIVVRLDRLARSVPHLLTVIEALQGRGALFRSLRDPIDTTTPQGVFALQVLGAVAQLERALIAERTRAGIAAAKARGRRPGNPGLRARAPAALRAIAAAREKTYLDQLLRETDNFLPVVKRLRPFNSWHDVAAVLNHAGQSWTVERLRRAVARLVREKLAPADLLARAPRRPVDDRLAAIVAGIALADPSLSLRQIAAQLEKMRERTPRGGAHWSPSSVKNLLDRRPPHFIFDNNS